ncbi:MAG: hypothetical protein ACYTFA_13020 [Planctomycetota bacterium]
MLPGAAAVLALVAVFDIGSLGLQAIVLVAAYAVVFILIVGLFLWLTWQARSRQPQSDPRPPCLALPLLEPRKLLRDASQAKPYVSRLDELLYGRVLRLVACANMLERPQGYEGDARTFIAQLEAELDRFDAYQTTVFPPQTCFRLQQPLAVLLQEVTCTDTARDPGGVRNASRFLVALLKHLTQIDAPGLKKWEHPAWCLAYHTLSTINANLSALDASSSARKVKQAVVQQLVRRCLALLAKHDAEQLPAFVGASLVKEVWPVPTLGEYDWDMWIFALSTAHEQFRKPRKLPNDVVYRASAAKLASIARHALVAAPDAGRMAEQAEQLHDAFIEAARQLAAFDPKAFESDDREWVEELFEPSQCNLWLAATDIDEYWHEPGLRKCKDALADLPSQPRLFKRPQVSADQPDKGTLLGDREPTVEDKSPKKKAE